MRKLVFPLILSLVFVGCSKKEENRLDKIEAKKHKKMQEETLDTGSNDPGAGYQRGFDAYRDIKDIRQEEHDRQQVEKEMIDQVDRGE